MRLSGSNTAAVPGMDCWYVFVLLSKFYVACRSTSTSFAPLLIMLLVEYTIHTTATGVPKFFTTRRIIQL